MVSVFFCLFFSSNLPIDLKTLCFYGGGGVCRGDPAEEIEFVQLFCIIYVIYVIDFCFTVYKPHRISSKYSLVGCIV